MSPPEIEIEVQIDDAFAGRVGAELLTRFAMVTLRHQGISQPTSLTLVVTGDGTVRRLNRTFRGVDAPTDVLAFGSEGEDDFAQTSRYLGDVIISFSRAEAQARRAGHPVENELRLLVAHGVLHLLGHDHAEPDRKATMWSAQDQILHDLADRD